MDWQDRKGSFEDGTERVRSLKIHSVRSERPFPTILQTKPVSHKVGPVD